MSAVIKSFFSWINAGIISALDRLPDSPFQFDLPPEFANLLGYINYFVPIGDFLKIMAGWLICIGVWYVISFLLRWAKVIQ